MTIDRTYLIFGYSRTSCTYCFFLGSISAMQFIQQ